jgi:ATP-dependent Clp protease ATP-binding subunit ClpC
MFERFTDRSRRAVILAEEEARRLNHTSVGTGHLLLGLIHEGEGVAAEALTYLGASLAAVRRQVEDIVGRGVQTPPSGHLPLTSRATRVLELSQFGHPRIGTEHVLLCLLRESGGVAVKVLVRLGLDPNRVRQQVKELLHGCQDQEPVSVATWAGSAPSTSLVLDQFGRNLTAAAREGKLDPVIGREQEIERVMQVLSRRTKNNPVLVGAPGVGKTAVVEGLAQKIVQGEVPDTIKDKQLYTLDMMAVAADPRFGYEQRLAAVLSEVSAHPEVVVLVEDTRALFGRAGPGDGDAASVARLKINRGEIQLVLSVTAQDYQDLLANDLTLQQRLQIVEVSELTIAQSVQILKGARAAFEQHHHVTISDDALEAAAELAARHIVDQPLPEKAVELLDQACAQVAMKSVAQVHTVDTARHEYSPVVGQVGKGDVAEALAVISGTSAADVLNDHQSERKPNYPPSEMTAADKEIWAMS